MSCTARRPHTEGFRSTHQNRETPHTVAVKIRLKRMGQIRAPFYRVVIADSRNKRDGRSIEEIGLYNPMTDPSTIEIKSERVQYWLSVGAQPTEQVAALLKVTGDWQKFKGLPGAEGTYRVPTPNTKPPRIPGGGTAKVVETPAEAPAAAAETPAEES
jgi:small subunit ribosomal protein S16